MVVLDQIGDLIRKQSFDTYGTWNTNTGGTNDIAAADFLSATTEGQVVISTVTDSAWTCPNTMSVLNSWGCAGYSIKCAV